MPSVKKVFHQLDDSYMEKISSPSYIDNVCIKCHRKLYVYEYDRILSACNETQYPYIVLHFHVLLQLILAYCIINMYINVHTCNNLVMSMMILM